MVGWGRATRGDTVGGAVKDAYEIGDQAWIFVGNHQGELSAGTVVHKFVPHGWPENAVHYVVEVRTSIDPLLEVRCPMSMASAAAGPIGLWELAASGARGS